MPAAFVYSDAVESDASGEALPSELIVFISDASAEAERLTLALRTQGYVVVDVPLALLGSRVAFQRPALVLCDADAEGALDTLERLRALAPDAPVPVILLGQRGGTMDRIDGALASAAFARPVNVRELVDTVERLVGTPAEGPKSLPPSARRGGFGSSSPPGKPRAEAAAVPLPPDLAGDPAPRENPEAPLLELSAEIQATLADAERRLSNARPSLGSARDEPEAVEGVEVVLPADVLSALDEPLDEEEAEEEERGQGTGEGTSPGGGRTGSRAHTQAGLTGLTGAERTGAQSAERGNAGRPGSSSDRPETARPQPEANRRARQEASTPRPPRPTADESPGATGTSELERRPSVAPTTAIDRADAAGQDAPPASRVDLEPRGTPGRDLSSTTPPLRRPAIERPPVKADSPVHGSLPPPTTVGTVVEQVGAAPGPGGEARAEAHEELTVPPVLGDGDALAVVASAIRLRLTGALRFEVDEGIRRIVLRDGDFVTAASAVHGESLVLFLAGRGDLPAEIGKLGHKLPAFGRRAGAALIAQGHLPQDRLWSVLRAHAEWLIGRIFRIQRGRAAVETTLVDRLRDEPAVFGGATGAEVFVEVVRRVVPEDEALARLGGKTAELTPGSAPALLGECALPALEAERIATIAGKTVSEAGLGAVDPSFTSALVALVALGVLSAQVPRRRDDGPEEEPDPLDDEARRLRILARKALVDDGDYFAVLGVGHDATAYDIRRAYGALKRDFAPAAALTPGTADLADTVGEILEVLDEAYDVLGDQRRRERYRRAIEAVPGP